MDSPDPGTGIEDRSTREKFKSERKKSQSPTPANFNVSRRDSLGRDLDYRKRPIKSSRSRSRSRSNSRERDNIEKRRRSLSPRSYVPDYERDSYPGSRYARPGSYYGYPSMMSDVYAPMYMYGGLTGSYGGNMGNGGRRGREDYGDDYGRSTLEDPSTVEYLYTKRQYADYLRKRNKRERGRRIDLDDETITQQYSEYKDEFMRRLHNKFFNKHQNEEWFREKYHPTESQKLAEEIKQRKCQHSIKFASDLNAGAIDAISYDQPEKQFSPSTIIEDKADEGKKNNETMDLDNKDLGEIEELDDFSSKDADLIYADLISTDEPSKREISEPVNSEFTLFIKSVPPKLERSTLIEICQSVEGFEHLSLSDPFPHRKFYRFGWVVFCDGTDLNLALETLTAKFKDLKMEDVSVFRQQSTLTQDRLIPFDFNSPSRVNTDVSLIKQLVKTFDQETGISDPYGGVSVERRLEEVVLPKLRSSLPDEPDTDLILAKKTLDMYICYLRRVHWYDYYTGHQASSPEDFGRRCPVQLRRRVPDQSDEHSVRRRMESLDQRTNLRINPPTESTPQLEKLGYKTEEKEIENIILKKIIKVDSGRYRCPIESCGKMFKAEHYLVKHIRGSTGTGGNVKVPGHPEIFKNAGVDVAFFNNFVLDQNKGLFMQPPAPPVTTSPFQMTWGMPNMMMPAQMHATNIGGNYQRGGYTSHEVKETREQVYERSDERLELDPRSRRSTKTYVDLDRPVAGGVDVDISYD